MFMDSWRVRWYDCDIVARDGQNQAVGYNDSVGVCHEANIDNASQLNVAAIDDERPKQYRLL